MDEGTLGALLDLQLEEELELTHETHLKFTVHLFSKLRHQSVR